MNNYQPATANQILPYRWIINPPTDRKIVARHLRKLRRINGRWAARECRQRMYFVGCFPHPEDKELDNATQ